MFTRRKLLNQSLRLSISQVFGAVLLALGILILLILGYLEWVDKSASAKDISSGMAIGFFLLMLGMVFFFPDMLKSSKDNNTSTMRVAVYMIISVFVFLCVKIGWNVESFKDFKLDSTWAYLIGIALGSKAAQSFSENKNNNISSPIPPTLNSGQNTGPNAGLSPGNNSAQTHDPSTIGNPPPDSPPPFITKQL